MQSVKWWTFLMIFTTLKTIKVYFYFYKNNSKINEILNKILKALMLTQKLSIES